MAQRDLRQAFEMVYESKTRSYNNVWLRRKLFEAIGSNAGSLKKKKPRRVIATTEQRKKQRKKHPSQAAPLNHVKPGHDIADTKTCDQSCYCRSPFIAKLPDVPPLFKTGIAHRPLDTAALDELANLAAADRLNPKSKGADDIDTSI